MIFTRILPALSFTIGTTALLFQMTVLYPWHIELDEEFQVLKQSQQDQLDYYHKNRLEKLDEINERVDSLIIMVKDLNDIKRNYHY